MNPRWVSDIKIRAERKCGEMLKATAQGGERVVGRCDAKKFHDGTSKSIELIDIGIGKKQSHRYQKLATIPEEVFESALSSVSDNHLFFELRKFRT